MTSYRMQILLLLGMLLSGPVHAEELLELVQRRMVAALGGAETWGRVTVLKLTGVRNRNGYEMGLVTWLARPYRVRVEHTLRGQRETFVWDGDRGWLAGFADGETLRPLEDEESRARLDEVQKYLRWPEVWELFASAELDGVEERQEGPAYRLLLTSESDGSETWLVDAQNGRILEIIEPMVGEEGERYEVHSFAWDYRDVGGVVLPFYVEIDHGTALYSIEVESVEVDPPVDDSLFAPSASDGNDPLHLPRASPAGRP